MLAEQADVVGDRDRHHGKAGNGFHQTVLVDMNSEVVPLDCISSSDGYPLGEIRKIVVTEERHQQLESERTFHERVALIEIFYGNITGI